jgi:hypothetical protein
MPHYRSGHKVEGGLIEGAVPLVLGIICIIILILAYEKWIRALLIIPPLTILGLYFGTITLNSIGRFLAVLGMVVCLLVLAASVYMLWSGGFFYNFSIIYS